MTRCSRPHTWFGCESAMKGGRPTPTQCTNKRRTSRMHHTSANKLRSGYQAALLTNPQLTFGNYVAATRLATNLGGRHPAITTNAILTGLAGGRSIGRTLQDLGLSERESKDAKKQVEREIKRSKERLTSVAKSRIQNLMARPVPGGVSLPPTG